MSLVHWDPLHEVSDLQRSVNRLFDTARLDGAPARGFPVDIYETDSEIVVLADLPGVRPEDVRVQFHGGQLSIRARRLEPDIPSPVWLRQERADGEFLRTFTLGTPITASDVEADHADGVLTVRLPKSEEARPRQVPVRSGAKGRGRGAAGPASGVQ